MASPVTTRYSTKHSGVSGMNTQLFVQHSGETPLKGGIALSLTEANNADLGWEASWPSFVDPSARVRQIAWPNTAWTQGWANPYSVGLECAGRASFSKADWLVPAGLSQLENLAHEWVYYWLKEKAVGNEIDLRWLSTPEVQKVMAGNRSISGFCTHAQIDPASRTDPGPNFPYDRLLNRIKQLLGRTSVAPAITTPTLTDFERIIALYKDKTEFETAMGRLMRANGVAYTNESVDKRDVYGRQTQMPADVVRHLLNYHNTTRTDRNVYALLVDAGLNSTTAKELAAKSLEELAAMRAQIETLVGAIAQLASGQQLDTDELLAQVTAASQDGVRRAIESIKTTVVIEDAPVDTVPELEAPATLEDQGEIK